MSDTEVYGDTKITPHYYLHHPRPLYYLSHCAVKFEAGGDTRIVYEKCGLCNYAQVIPKSVVSRNIPCVWVGIEDDRIFLILVHNDCFTQ